MSRALPSPPLSSLTLSQLQAMANDMDSALDRTPKDWFERARYEVEKATISERKGKKEEMFVAYTRAAQCYMHCRGHPQYAAEKGKDVQWGNRVKEFRAIYEMILGKAKETKDQLKARDLEGSGRVNGSQSMPSTSASAARPDPPRPKSPGTDTHSGGSIADRMKALSGRGMDVGGPKRSSRDLGSTNHIAGADNINRRRAESGTLSERPIVPKKPDVLQASSGWSHPPSPPPSQQSVLQNKTGSSSRSRDSTVISEKDSTPPSSAFIPSQPAGPRAAPQHLPPTPVSSQSLPDPSHTQAGPSKRPSLPPIPKSPSREPIHLNGTDKPTPVASKHEPEEAGDTSGIRDFAAAFPSLSEFGKQFDDIDGPSSNAPAYPFERDPDAPPPPEDDRSDVQFPQVPSFPDLPRAPTNMPGFTIPSRPDGLRSADIKGPSPPSPDIQGLPRPASTANVASLASSFPDKRDPSPIDQSYSNEQTRSPPFDGDQHTPLPSLTFPVAKPTPGQPSTPKKSSLPPPPEASQKPKFPYTNFVEPDTLRSYFLNPAVDVLLLDLRSEDEFRRGYVGQEYEARGAKVKVVWTDPTVLMRDGMTSSKLEDSLSLSPEPQRRAFLNRHKFDLVIVYDSHSVNWPTKGSPPNPMSRLWSIIYEHEFEKKLDRTPVILTGGYDAWAKFIDGRVRKHQMANGQHRREGAESNGGRPYNPKLPNGHESMPLAPRETNRLPHSPSLSGDLAAKRANRDVPVYQASHYAKNISDSFGYAQTPQSMTGEHSYTGHQPSRPYVSSPPPVHQPSRHAPSNSVASSSYSPIAPPPQASIHPGPGARRRSDYVEHSTQPYSGSRPSIDYPQPHALSLVQPPPAAQGHGMERYDARPSVVRSGSIRGLDLVANQGDDVRYWNDIVLGLTGLKNLGNTCYMNSTLQCLSATYPFTSIFLDGSFKRAINLYNPLGTKGNLAVAFAELLKALWEENYTFLSPVTFRKNINGFAPQFSGTDQHDSQEFLSFVLDGLHEDLNRVKHKPPAIEMTPEREQALETLPPEVASEKEWQIYRMRNDSFIVDLFQGQYRNRLECLTCHKTSTTYDAFMYMSLPVPAGKSKVVVQELIDEFVKAEVMDNEDAWNCPRCKVPRRATKTLTIARLPPVLLIQLKRFTTQNGMFWDKSETPVIFPIHGLDLTRYVPARQRTGIEEVEDPRTQVGPFRYDLYGVSNHMGTLSSGHYTAYVKSAKGWMFCEDSKISKASEKDVVSRPAYILFYKRIRV